MHRPFHVATTLVCAGSGGTAADDEGRLRLSIPAGALAVDTVVTVVSVTLLPSGKPTVQMAWRVIAHPGPAVLSDPATVTVTLPTARRSAQPRLLVTDDATSLDDGWSALPRGTQKRGLLKSSTWYLPPSAGPPPVRASSLLCLVFESTESTGG